MIRKLTLRFALSLSCLAPAFVLGETYSLTIPTPTTPTPSSDFHLGTATSPNNPTLTVDGQSILSNGKPILPVMGEFHYSRVPHSQWRTELLKMKAGGITIVSTYVFWIHHEELENKWDWTGDRDLHAFLDICKEINLPVIVRMGPWCHGEVRNGGFPEWLLDKKLKTRSTDPAFMAEVKILYQQIADQIKGFLYKDGGPVIGIQVDNEYRGPAAYLLSLKKLAQDVGIDVPFYNRTGWPATTTPVPFGELLPLYGAYAEGFWDRGLTSMPGNYWQAFTIVPVRTDTSVGADILGKREHADESDTQSYPYLTCELGGGMATSYHRRINIDPMDCYAIELAKLASGSNLPGFYMYHGGVNPEPETPAPPYFQLQERQATRMTNYNDLPVKSYDFNAPLGSYGEVRESYHLLRELHTFLHDFGPSLAAMPTTFAPKFPIQKTDIDTLRYSVRSDGKSGFVFINNYQRGADMPKKKDIQFSLTLAGSTLALPKKSLNFPTNTAAFFPFNLPLNNATLTYATAQPLAQIVNGDTTVTVFTKINDLPANFHVHRSGRATEIFAIRDMHPDFSQEISIPDAQPGTKVLMSLHDLEKIHHVLLLSPEDSKRLYHLTIDNVDYLILSDHPVYTDGHTLSVERSTLAPLSFSIYPTPPAFANQPAGLLGGANPQSDGLFTKLTFTYTSPIAPPVSIDQKQKAGTPRAIKMGINKAAEEPTDTDFTGPAPAIYTITLPTDANEKRNLLLKLNYLGDCARLYSGDTLLLDNFYNGTTMNFALNTLTPDQHKHPLTLKILPLTKDAPIYIQKEYRPDFTKTDEIATLRAAELTETVTANFHFSKD